MLLDYLFLPQPIQKMFFVKVCNLNLIDFDNDYFCRISCVGSQAELKEFFCILFRMINEGYNVNCRHSLGRTPLHCSVYKGNKT